MRKGTVLFGLFAVAVLLLFTACGAKEDIDNSENVSAESDVQTENSFAEESSGNVSEAVPSIPSTENHTDDGLARYELVAEQILTGADGDIHYSYYLPENFDESRTYEWLGIAI